MSVPTKEQLKARSKHLAKLLEEKFNVKASHSQCLDVVAQLFGHKDWNTASAASPSDESEGRLPRYRLIEALLQGFHFFVEQPYKVDKFFAGRAVANQAIEEGSHLFDQFKGLKVDPVTRQVTLTLPQITGVSASNEVVDMHKQGYQQREKDFAEMFVGDSRYKDWQEQVERDHREEMKKYKPSDDRS